jgi:ribokinase
MPVVDTTGAGDAFAAGFLYGLIKDKELDECGRLGNTVARLCISKTGARQGLPDAARLVSEYKKIYG